MEAEKRAAEQARQRAEAERQQIESSLRRLAETERKAAVPTRQAALAVPKPIEPPSAPVRPAVAAGRDGIYGGEICYGPNPGDPARCFREQAIVQKDKISGQWPGRDPGVTMYLTGDVTATGDVTIHVHGERTDGSHLAVIDLAGTLQNGRIDAKGSFRGGRGVTLNWQKH
jgi:hypothetical protein